MSANGMQIEMVPLDRLVVDMPVDARNVETKMLSLKESGLGQPIVVWRNDLRIIDGLHRVEAAKRLGWAEIACVVRDIDEESFWSFRIQSARQHARVTEDRLVKWISECWKATPWFAGYALDEARQDALLAAANVLWQFNLGLKTEPVTMDGKTHYGGYYELPQESVPVFQWFSEKAALWDMDLERVMGVIFGAHGLKTKNVSWQPATLHVAKERGLDLPGLLQLDDQLGMARIGNRNGDIPPLVVNDYLDDKGRPGESLIAYSRRRKQEERDAEWQADMERERLAQERYDAERAEKERARLEEEHRKSEQSRLAKEEQERILRAQVEFQVRQEMQRAAIAEPTVSPTQSAGYIAKARICDMSDQFYAYVMPRREVFRAMPDGADVLLGFATRLIETINDIWPERRVPLPRPVDVLFVPAEAIALSAKEIA